MEQDSVEIKDIEPVNAVQEVVAWESVACYNDASNINLNFAVGDVGQPAQNFLLSVDVGFGACNNTARLISKISQHRCKHHTEIARDGIALIQEHRDRSGDGLPQRHVMASDYSRDSMNSHTLNFLFSVSLDVCEHDKQHFAGIPDPSDFHCSSVNFSDVHNE